MSRHWTDAEFQERGKAFVLEHKNGATAQEIADRHGYTRYLVSKAMYAVGHNPGSIGISRQAPQLDGRPLWSYPDPITLRIVRETRAEMERAKR